MSVNVTHWDIMTNVNYFQIVGVIFARMSPDQKQQLVQDLQGLGYCVGEYDFTLSL